MRHLKAFSVFNVAAETSNFSEAAIKLHLTHGAVSKQIKTLEGHLSTKLFVKQGRNVCLTHEGKVLKRYTSEAFETLVQGVNQITQVSNHSLNVSCEPTLTMRWLMPRISNFYEQNPNTDIRLSTAGGSINLEAKGLSMAIRRDDFEPHHNYQSKRLVEEWVGPVVSPEYWERVKGDLTKLKLIHSDTRPNAWLKWSENTNNQTLLQNASQNFAHFYFCFQAAVDGLGAAIGSYPLVVDDLQRGNLIAPFGFVLSGHNYVVLSKEKESNTELHTKFINWLENQLINCVPKNNAEYSQL